MRVRNLALLRATLVCLPLLISVAGFAQSFPDVKPSPVQLEWEDMEMGVLIHFGVNTFVDREWSDGTVGPEVFDPREFNPQQWVTAAKSAGAKYVLFVAKHIDGFCLWPSAYTQYTVARSRWRNGKGDAVKEVAEACYKQGMKFGIYLAPWDRHAPFYENAAAYSNYYAQQLEELISPWGDLGDHNQIFELWLDGGGTYGHQYDWELIVRTLRNYQPDALVLADLSLMPWQDIRWGYSESGVAPEEVWDVAERLGDWRWRPPECDTPLHSGGWFWHPQPQYSQSLKSVAQLMETYNITIGHGANLLLGLEPDRRGLLPDADVARLREFGDAIRRTYGEEKNLARNGTIQTEDGSSAAALNDGDQDTFWMAPAQSHSATLELSFTHPTTIDRTVLMEWLNMGQRIEKYAIQAWDGERWRTLHAGTSIGHKKIDLFSRTTTAKIRLRILAATGPPALREFQAFDGTK